MLVIKRAAIHLSLALLLVVAQFGALTHSVWHLGHRTPHALAETATPSEHHGSKSPAQNGGSLDASLCDLHFIMGSVLAGDCASASTWPATTPILSHSRVSTASVVVRASPTPPARGPPRLL